MRNGNDWSVVNKAKYLIKTAKTGTANCNHRLANKALQRAKALLDSAVAGPEGPTQEIYALLAEVAELRGFGIRAKDGNKASGAAGCYEALARDFEPLSA